MISSNTRTAWCTALDADRRFASRFERHLAAFLKVVEQFGTMLPAQVAPNQNAATGSFVSGR